MRKKATRGVEDLFFAVVHDGLVSTDKEKYVGISIILKFQNSENYYQPHYDLPK